MNTKKVLLINDTSLICHHGCHLLMNSIYNLMENNNFIIKKKIYYEENYLNYISDINKFDLILINGEGTIHGKINSDSKKVKEIIEFINQVKKNHKIPLVIFNSTIASLKKKQLKIIKLVDKIYVREKYSYNYLKKKNIHSTILPDLLSLLSFSKIKNDKGQILVTDSSLMRTSKKLLEFASDKNYKFIPILYNNYLRYLRYFTFKFALKFKLFFMIKLYLYLKDLYLKKFLQEIVNSSFIITGRFHGIFICLSMMKPFYTFKSDTYKIKGLIKMIGLDKRIIDINKIPNKKLNGFEKSEILKIKRFKTSSAKKFNKFIKELHHLISGKKNNL